MKQRYYAANDGKGLVSVMAEIILSLVLLIMN